MNQAKRRLLLGAYKLVDVGLVLLSLGLTTILVVSGRTTMSLADFLASRVKVENAIIFAGFVVVCYFIFSLSGLYESKRLSSRGPVILDSLKATTLASICLMLVAMLFAKGLINTTFLLLFWVFTSVSVVSARLAMRHVLARLRLHGRNLRHILILGTNARAIEFARRIKSKPELGYRVVGFVDEQWQGSQEFRETGYGVCCNFATLADFLRRNVVDEVASFVPLRSFYEHASQVAALCEMHGVIMRLDSDLFNLKIARSRAEDFDGNPQIAAYGVALESAPALMKRVLDVVVSSVSLVLLSPTFVVVALIIKLTSKGPVLFEQERVGLNKRRFSICKFRTMVPGAEKLLEELEHLNEASGPVFKIKDDPRLTPVGRFLRQTSLDEFPQLWNVLKGDMSLVGPRPLPVRDYEGFSEDWQRRRFSVRPGITCLWQVNGRSSIPFEKWMELDMQYLDQWSLWLDVKIIARTIPAVLKRSGAA
ncbi:MAG: sugar transferase [Candidatus Acidiferrales bacterium]